MPKVVYAELDLQPGDNDKIHHNSNETVEYTEVVGVLPAGSGSTPDVTQTQ